ncbi:hypothetical protein HHK36_013370 [Tetracentron sinense]|uniref:Uncharacterized protein n=1 Tax=Tetracentron sinense TaxID=13715 RepID=A0A834ZAZ2_TETSI|nr:hypothetical protein HHK36_013370 [Tetracentron sinense]
MPENYSTGIKDGTNKVSDKRRVKKRVNDCHNPTHGIPIKRVCLSLFKPSYTPGLNNVRTEHRGRLRRLLNKLVRQHNWKEASGILSVLLKGTCNENSPVNNRRKYWVTMELLKQTERNHINPAKIKHIYEIWMRKIGSMKNWPVKDRCVVQLEFILFCLTQGNIEEAHQASICLMQEPELGGDPISNMMVGLTFYQLWYSAIPKEMKLRNSDTSDPRMPSEMYGTRSNSPAENSDGHNAVGIHEVNFPIRCDSDTSVGDYEEICENNNGDIHKEQSHQDFQPKGFYMQDAVQLLPHSDGKLEDSIYLHREMLNGYYTNAVKHLRLALYSTPPLLEALLPLIQLLLIGDQVKEALKELKKLCHNSNAPLPFRLMASLLECFDNKHCNILSACYEDILKKDPVCSHSLASLIAMHKNGDYSLESLLEMIALHLDSTYAACSIWGELASCFLRLSQYEEDRMSICGNENENGCKQWYSVRSTTIPRALTEGISRKSWRLRCRWWATRHFSEDTHKSEMEAGELQLLTFKASCASHLYGPEFEYVVNVHTCLKKEENKDRFLFLKMHIQNSIRLHENLNRGN